MFVSSWWCGATRVVDPGDVVGWWSVSGGPRALAARELGGPGVELGVLPGDPLVLACQVFAQPFPRLVQGGRALDEPDEECPVDRDGTASGHRPDGAVLAADETRGEPQRGPVAVAL